MSWIVTIKKGVLGFFTGLTAVVVLGVVQSLSNYNPVICSTEVTENCTPQFVVSAYMSIVPVVSAFLVSIANWLKNRNK